MKKIFLLLIILLSITACHTTKMAGNQTDHQAKCSVGTAPTSYETAVKIQEKTETAGVAAEYEWIRKNYPGSKTGGQSLLEHNKIPYDKIEITTAGGEKLDLYFDISKFFGKF
jgi:hypothetical protein